MRVFALLLLVFLAFGASLSDYLMSAERLIKQMKGANAQSDTPYLYSKALGYYEGMLVYISDADREGAKSAFNLFERNARKAIRGAYTNREPMTELIVFEPRLFFEEHCDGIMDECFYERRYEKQELLELLDYFSLKKRVEFLRRNNALYCAPEHFGRSEAFFNLISWELMRQKPSEEKLLTFKEKLLESLTMAEELLRYAMKTHRKCYYR
ncbi:MAG: hypothetical protein GXO04_00310 [Aquificae bacterium]|nr:hypothetical protein [Aquificota bacterium]